MRNRIISILLAGILGIGMAACADGSAMGAAGPETEAETAGEEEDYSMEVPAAVETLSEEDEILLNGELKDGVYINRYFGYKLTAPENWTLTRDNDDAVESKEIIPLAETYEEGWGGLYFSATSEEPSERISVLITALEDDLIGADEEELIKDHIRRMTDANEALGDEGGPEPATAVLAGEEHPAAVEIEEIDGDEYLSACFRIPRNGFEYQILISGKNLKLEDLTKYFEKL